jgi:hypothetical protein
MVRAWLKYYRPVLTKVRMHFSFVVSSAGWARPHTTLTAASRRAVQRAEHQYVFVHKNGTAPRISFWAQVRGLQHGYIGKSAAPHSFRGMQVSSPPPRTHSQPASGHLTVSRL